MCAIQPIAANGCAAPDMVATPARGEGASLLLRVFAWLGERRERRLQRQALASLDEAMLKDIGLSSADVDREIDRLSWRLFR